MTAGREDFFTSRLPIEPKLSLDESDSRVSLNHAKRGRMGISGFILLWILLSCAVSPFIGMFLARSAARTSQEADEASAASRLARMEARALPSRMGIRALRLHVPFRNRSTASRAAAVRDKRV